MTAFEKVKASSARAVAMMKELDVETTRYEELRLIVEQHMDFAHK